MNSYFIHSRRVLINGVLKEATLTINDGKISAINLGEPVAFNEIESVGNSVLMPGIIDSHVHINEPGRTEWEGFETATKAAAAGGITTLVDMPLNSSPVTTNVKSLNLKTKATEGKLHVNCGFWGGIVPHNLKELKELIDAGVLGIKAFLTHSGIDDFPNVTEEELRAGMKIIAQSDVPLLAHCELDSEGHDGDLNNNPKSYQAFLKSRPKQWEDDAITMMIELCKETKCHTHVVHLSSANSIQQLQEAREVGLPLTAETCSHYLFFNSEDIPDGETVYKCAPPIREKENNEQLWQGIKDGVIDFIITDHSPAAPEIKELTTGNLHRAWGGISGLQYSLPAVWKKGEERGLKIADVSKLMSENIANFLKLGHKKGIIKEGYDADLIVWNPEKEFKVTCESIQHRHKISAYEGHTLKGVIERTYVNGEKVFDNGTFTTLNKGKIILRNGK